MDYIESAIFFCCLAPMFMLLSCDYDRLYQSLFVTSYALFLILPTSDIIKLFPKWYLTFVSRLNTGLNHLVVPTKGLMILMLLFFAVNLYGFSPTGAIRMSVVYTDYYWIARLIKELASLIL